MEKLQLVQNTAAHLLSGQDHCELITSVLLSLHWFPFYFCYHSTVSFKLIKGQDLAQFGARSSQLAAGTCEIVTLDRDSSQPRRTIARQTARCACKKGQIAGTTRARPACVDGKSSSWNAVPL
uniref:TAFA chemokine like family member 5 n=1 Tax=Chelonoidis abingdonii TaxID=106734 RepID=A0A8C0GT07_CHEAB